MIHRMARFALGAFGVVVSAGACGGGGQVGSGAPAAPSLQPDDAATTNVATPPPMDRWAGMPPLVGEGRVIHQAHYDITQGESVLGEERLVVGVVDGKRVVVAQSVADFGGHYETSYMVAPAATTVSVKATSGVQQLAGKIVDGVLTVTGTGVAGEPVSLSARLPEGAFLSGPGMGGTIILADKLGEMAVGQKKKLDMLQIGFAPSTKIVSARHDVERKADADGQRVFTVTTEAGRFVQTAELVLDRDGFVVKEVIRGPLNHRYTRRP